MTDSDLGRPDLLTPDKEASPATLDLLCSQIRTLEIKQPKLTSPASWNCVYSLLQFIIQSSD